MIELQFPEDLYDGFAIDEVVKTYEPFASIALARETARYIVRVTALPSTLDEGISEADISAELANAALGKTIEKRGATR